MMLSHVLDSRALPEISWEDSSVLWQAARGLVRTWMDQIAKDVQALRYLDLDLVSLFEEQVLAKLAYPALMTCAQLDLARKDGTQRIVLWDNNSVSCRTVRAYARAHGIPLTVRTQWSKILHPFNWAQNLDSAHYLLQASVKARIRWQNRSVSRKSRASQNILVLVAHGHYARSVLPVLETIRDSVGSMIVPLDHKVDRFLARWGWPSTIPSDHIPDSRRSLVRQSQRELHRKARELMQRPMLFAPFREAQVDLALVAQPLIQALLRVQVPMAIPVLEGLQAIIQRQQPRLILSVPDRRWRARAAIQLGRRANIPSLMIQAAVISNHARYDTLVADRVAVMGDSSRQLWQEQGIAAERLVITGSPRFDEKFRLEPGAPRRIRKALNIPLEKQIITFATQPLSPAVITQNVLHVVRAMQQFPHHQLVVKVHPREELGHYQAFLPRLDARGVIVKKDLDLNALLQASALVITGFSTVALEAMIFERPVLVVNLTGEPDPVDYVKSGAALGAYSAEDIVTQMKRLLTDAHVNEELAEARRRYVTAQLYRTDGQAAQRVAALIQQMATTHGSRD
jgi:glycosyltransferase involved in cell wall biosynthesis